jgi:pre-mRNA-splicing factor SPF27
MASEYARLEAQIPISGIDTSRYEALSAPTPSTSKSGSEMSDSEIWKETLAKAYTSQTYLASRLSQLQSLETSGKEEWLASNESLVTILSGLEKELQDTKEGIDRVVLERQAAQEAVKAEIGMLEKNWREGVGRVLEAEVAAEGLRGRVLEERRRGGRGGV